LKIQSLTRASWDQTVQGTAIAVSLLALIVLVGWHTHVRVAVQIFHGLVPMQYNTALCFLAIGAGGVGLRRRSRPLLLGGGGFAALMGAIVVLEYATGISFGIDTLFFYPWERSLTAFDGRMALTTALSFFLVGGTLVTLAVRQGAHAILGIVNSIPLSLALTSLLGYSFHISYVLPFDLGAQMALHTASAFLIYGIAMLGYAWKYAKRGTDGLPKWAAGIGVAFLPVLLVVAGALFAKQTWQVVPFEALFSIVGIGLFTLAILKLNKVKVAYKGLLMIGSPLVLLLGFVGLVVHVKERSQSAQELALRTKEVIGVSQSLLGQLADAEGANRGYLITGDKTFFASYARSLELAMQATTRLRDLVADNPLQESRAEVIEHLTAQKMDHLSEIGRLVATGNRPQAEEMIKKGRGADLMNQVRTEMGVFSLEEERIDAERRKALDLSWQRLSWLLVAGTSGSILLASILSLVFSGGISIRLEQLRNNAISLAAGGELAAPLAGSDEIAELDRVFHSMAEALDEVTRREKAVIEGTTDAIFVKDLEHRFLMMNQAGADLIGMTVEEVIGASIHDIFVPETARLILERDNEIVGRGVTETYELRAVTKTGVKRTYLATRGPYVDRRGTVVGIVGINRDITEQKLAEAALIESDRRFRDLFFDAPIGYHELDVEGRITCVNTTELLMLGYSSEEMTGHHVWDFIEEAETARLCFAEKLGGHKPLPNVERRFRRKDGSLMDVQLDDQLLRDPSGRVTGIRATIQDIGERKLVQAELKENELQLIEAQHIARLGSWSWDIATNTTIWSAALYHIYGLHPEDCPATYEGYLSVVHPDDRANVSLLVERAVRTGQEMSYEHRIIWPDKSVRFHHVNLKVAFDEIGQPVKLFGTSQDVTDRVQQDDDLKEARDAAIESARLKSEFLANMSHEIRTPMNGVVGITGLLLDTDLTAEQRDYTETISASADALLTIIDDILDFSKIEAGLLRFEKIDFDLRGAVEAAVELLAERAQAKGLELASFVHEDVPTALQGDPGRLRQVLTNLIGNAVKFTGHGEVVASVTKVGETGSHATLRFEIRDTGIGISPEAQKRLFRAFTQADGSTTRKYGGTGLGLAISKQLVELMGGQIGIDSSLGHGSTFWFTAEFGRQSEPAMAAGTAGNLSSARVLIVDDNATNRSILNHQTSAWGMIAAEAASGARALELLRIAAKQGRPYDIAILDLLMPRMDGFQLAEAIKADPSIAAVVVVVLASFGECGHGERAGQVGIAAYLQKPVRQSKLYDCLTSVRARSGGTERSKQPKLVTRRSMREDEVLKKDKTYSLARIIVAEDNVVNQKVALGQLKKLGYRAEVVPNGRALLEALEDAEFDLILMDCQMPEMDGFAATAEIRRVEGAARHTTIIAMTANVLDGDDKRCLAAGMDDYLSKPVRSGDLRRKLDLWLKPAKTAFSAGESGEATIAATDRTSSVIDRAQLANLRAAQEPGKADVVTELIDVFFKETVSQLDVLRNAAATNDRNEIRRVARSLRGSSANVGAQKMAALSERLEGTDGTNGDVRAVLGRLDQEFELVREALNAERIKTAV
jgi:two-component system, sensor histidine kinase and response regulator